MKKSKKAFYNNGKKYYRLYDENGKEIGWIDPIFEKTQTNFLKGVSLFLLTRDGYLVLEKRNKNTEITPGDIDLISGHRDNHEKGKQTVYRESKEEIGIKKKKIVKIKKVAKNVPLRFRGGRKFLISFYAGMLRKKAKKFKLQESEVEEVMIVPMQEGFDLIRKNLTKFPYTGNEEIFEEIFKKVELFYKKSLKREKKVVEYINNSGDRMIC